MDAEENVADDTAADAGEHTHRAHPEDVESLGDAHQAPEAANATMPTSSRILSSTGQGSHGQMRLGRSPRVELL